ncbi:stromal interaction molecule homolog isoform X2 [Episyrphus balteatus]|uniref:stromal interaction molecule homolog isoform X2 n=1 Tax=Episyrphus balteatus TaxID=286459 RepID=UPI00248690B5|nr:stromal interaction molecule homolog isoform X2 [Episyrphus balteatus]
MLWNICLILVISLVSSPHKHSVSGGGAPGDSVVITAGALGGNRFNPHSTHELEHHQQLHHHPSQKPPQQQQQHQQHSTYHSSNTAAGSSGGSQQQAASQISTTATATGAVGGGGGAGGSHAASSYAHHHGAPGSGHIDHRHSYNLLSEAMSQAVSNEFSALGSGSADGACHADDLDCYGGNIQDRLGMEAIRTLHRQLDDDDNGNIDLSESDDFLREELKYDSGYEKRQKAFHFNDDMHISVKELWEAWLRSEVHNWTIEQTTDWLAQSVQLPQYVELFKAHKVTGAALPRLAVNNMHYVGNVLGIKDPIHKQKVALKAMDVVLFGPPRETGTRWKDYILVTLLLSAIIGCWYAYQQNKNAKRHLRRMAQDMEGLQRAEQSLQEMQKELERARMEQENVATEKMDLERRLKEAPSLTSSSSDLEVQQLKKEIEMLRSELSRAEIELVDNCWAPPAQLQSWLQYTYELESKNHLKKRVSAEKQLQSAREACEKLRKKRSSLVGAFVSTHGKSIDDVDRSIVEARNSLSDVTNELQERLHRWKQIETCLGFNIVNNNGLAYLENVLYSRNGGGGAGVKGSRGRMTNSTDDLDDESVQGMSDSNFSRNSVNSSGLISTNNLSTSGGGGGGGTDGRSVGIRDDSSCSDDGTDNQSVHFFLGPTPAPPPPPSQSNLNNRHSGYQAFDSISSSVVTNHIGSATPITPITTPATATAPPTGSGGGGTQMHNSHAVFNSNDSSSHHSADDSRHSPSVSSERSIPIPPRTKKPSVPPTVPTPPSGPIGRAPLPPPRRTNQSHIIRSQSTDLVPMEIYNFIARQQQQHQQQQQQQQSHGKVLSPRYNSSSQQCLSNQPAMSSPAATIVAQQLQQLQQHIFDFNCGTAASAAADNFRSLHDITAAATAAAAASVASSGAGDQEPLIDTGNHPSAPPFITKSSGTGSLQQSLQLKQHPSIGPSTTAAQSAAITTTTHGDTQVDDTNSTDSSSLDDELKKRRRKLRFPFGKKSHKSKLA